MMVRKSDENEEKDPIDQAADATAAAPKAARGKRAAAPADDDPLQARLQRADEMAEAGHNTEAASTAE